MSILKVIIAGGGTGGHIFPAVAVGHALRRSRPDTDILFVGALGRMEMEKVPQEGFEIIGLDITGFNRGSLLANWSLPYKLLKSRIQARRIIRRFKPTVVMGVGGYASFPMLSAAQTMGIPTLIQEQNSFAGKSNKILGRGAKAVCVAYSGMERFFPAEKISLTGNPVRKIISGMNLSSPEGKKYFGLNPDKFTLLVTGGSLGAKTINGTIDANLDSLLHGGYQIIWQTGKLYYEKGVQRTQGLGGSVKAVEFIREMDKAYAAADLVISRAGALAIAEICIAARPVIFIPYPYAAENHQESNAQSLVDKKAALMIRDEEARSKLVDEIRKLAANETLRKEMTKNLTALAIRDADERIAEKIIEITG